MKRDEVVGPILMHTNTSQLIMFGPRSLIFYLMLIEIYISTETLFFLIHPFYSRHLEIEASMWIVWTRTVSKNEEATA